MSESDPAVGSFGSATIGAHEAIKHYVETFEKEVAGIVLDAKNTRKYCNLSGLIAICVGRLHIVPTEITALGIKFGQIEQDRFPTLIGGVAAYFFVSHAIAYMKLFLIDMEKGKAVDKLNAMLNSATGLAIKRDTLYERSKAASDIVDYGLPLLVAYCGAASCLSWLPNIMDR